MQNQGALRWSPPEALSPFFRGDVSVYLAPGGDDDLAIDAGQKIGEKYEAGQLTQVQACACNSVRYHACH